VQRHWNNSIGLSQNFMRGAADPAAHHGREIKPFTIFESMHQGTRDLVKAQGNAGAVVGRRIGDCFHGQDARAGIIDEGNAKPLTKGPGDEGQLRPAGCTEPHRLAADRAQPRQGEIERGAEHHAGAFAGALEPRKCCDAGWLPHEGTLPARAGVVKLWCSPDAV
jgi:hypothetical protein